jgi:caa(3)-type oxidase subunit IV
MTDEARNTEDHGDHGATVRAYLIVFVALAFFTLASFVANYAAAGEHPWISKHFSFVIILGVAVVKAVLVGLIFMHLKFDWRKLYFMIFPAFILGAMMMMVLMPDIVLAWQH